MIMDILEANFDGFDYPGDQVRLFSRDGNIFYCMLRNGNSVVHETQAQDSQRFWTWLVLHRAKDTRLVFVSHQPSS